MGVKKTSQFPSDTGSPNRRSQSLKSVLEGRIAAVQDQAAIFRRSLSSLPTFLKNHPEKGSNSSGGNGELPPTSSHNGVTRFDARGEAHSHKATKNDKSTAQRRSASGSF